MGLEIDEKQAKLAETGQIRENLSLKGPFRKNFIIDFVVLSINATWASDICIVVFNILWQGLGNGIEEGFN